MMGNDLGYKGIGEDCNGNIIVMGKEPQVENGVGVLGTTIT